VDNDASHGMEGGEAGIDDQVAAESLENVGATVMGRNVFGGGPGPWRDDEPWKGWWGDEPPFHTPVFVLTHHPREPGARLFDLPPGWQDRYERTRLVASPAVAHFRYRRVG
jgi:hypothetical protein